MTEENKTAVEIYNKFQVEVDWIGCKPLCQSLRYLVVDR